MNSEGNRMKIFLIITVGLPVAVGILDLNITHETLFTVFLVSVIKAFGTVEPIF